MLGGSFRDWWRSRLPVCRFFVARRSGRTVVPPQEVTVIGRDKNPHAAKEDSRSTFLLTHCLGRRGISRRG